MSKFKNVPPELIERVLEATLSYEDSDFSGEKANELLHVAKDLYQAMQPKEYLLFGHIPVKGEPPLSEAPEYGQTFFMLDKIKYLGYYEQSFDSLYVLHTYALYNGLAFATEQGAQAAAKALGWYEEGE